MVLRETYRTMTIDHDHDQKLKFKIFRAVCTFAMLSLIVEISYTFTAVLVPLSSYSTFSACPCLDHHMVCPVPYRKVGVGNQYTRGGALERFNQHFLMWFSRVRPHRIARKAQVLLYVCHTISIHPASNVCEGTLDTGQSTWGSPLRQIKQHLKGSRFLVLAS